MSYVYVIRYVCGTKLNSLQLLAALHAAPACQEVTGALHALLTLGTRGQVYSYQADDTLSHCAWAACRALGMGVDDIARAFRA